MNLIDEKLSAFSLGRLADAASVMKILARLGISNREFCDAVAARQELSARRIRQMEERMKKEKADALRRLRTEGAAKHPQKKRPAPRTMRCPKCGQVAYAQPVCPNCSKGRAGIRTEYICGECNFVFYV